MTIISGSYVGNPQDFGGDTFLDRGRREATQGYQINSPCAPCGKKSYVFLFANVLLSVHLKRISTAGDAEVRWGRVFDLVTASPLRLKKYS